MLCLVSTQAGNALCPHRVMNQILKVLISEMLVVGAGPQTRLAHARTLTGESPYCQFNIWTRVCQEL